MPTPVPTVLPRRAWRRAAVSGIALASVVTLVATASSEAVARPSVKVAANAKAGPKPGLAGKPIPLVAHGSFDGDFYGGWVLGADKSGTAYMAWIAAKPNSTNQRDVFFCTLPHGAKACKGGIQEIASPDSSSIAGLNMLVTPKGQITLLWYASDTADSGIIESTSDKGGALTTPTLVTHETSAGSLLDASFGPGRSIWTAVLTGTDGKTVDVRNSLTASPMVLKAPSQTSFNGIGSGNIAFAGKTPIVVIAHVSSDDGPYYSYEKGGSWKPFKMVKGTVSGFHNFGLTTTKSGVRLTAGSPKNLYQPVVSSWNGHGFSKPQFTGDHNDCTPGSVDTSADASGRMVDVSNECGEITVDNLADTKHSAIFRFGAPKAATLAGSDPQIVTTPRGHGWVAWGVEPKTGTGVTLKVVPILLAGLKHHKSGHGPHGSVTITGPTTCQPASSIKIGVSGKGAKGWKVTKTSLKLGKKKVGSVLNGARLKPGKKYALKGTATFSDGHGHSRAKGTLKFKACPKP